MDSMLSWMKPFGVSLGFPGQNATFGPGLRGALAPRSWKKISVCAYHWHILNFLESWTAKKVKVNQFLVAKLPRNWWPLSLSPPRPRHSWTCDSSRFNCDCGAPLRTWRCQLLRLFWETTRSACLFGSIWPILCFWILRAIPSRDKILQTIRTISKDIKGIQRLKGDWLYCHTVLAWLTSAFAGKRRDKNTKHKALTDHDQDPPHNSKLAPWQRDKTQKNAADAAGAKKTHTHTPTVLCIQERYRLRWPPAVSCMFPCAVWHTHTHTAYDNLQWWYWGWKGAAKASQAAFHFLSLISTTNQQPLCQAGFGIQLNLGSPWRHGLEAQLDAAKMKLRSGSATPDEAVHMLKVRLERLERILFLDVSRGCYFR